MNQRTILLVEDNPDDVELTLRALKANRITEKIIVARDGVEALALLEEWVLHPESSLPALVLLDLNLPRVDGFEVLRKLRAEERTAHLPVVILTTSREERDLMSGYGLGANSYVHKPVEYAAFSEAIRQLGLYWLGMNLLPVEG